MRFVLLDSSGNTGLSAVEAKFPNQLKVIFMRKKDLLIIGLITLGMLGIIFAATYVLYHPHTVPVDEFIYLPVLTMGTH